MYLLLQARGRLSTLVRYRVAPLLSAPPLPRLAPQARIYIFFRRRMTNSARALCVSWHIAPRASGLLPTNKVNPDIYNDNFFPHAPAHPLTCSLLLLAAPVWQPPRKRQAVGRSNDHGASAPAQHFGPGGALMLQDNLHRVGCESQPQTYNGVHLPTPQLTQN